MVPNPDPDSAEFLAATCFNVDLVKLHTNKVRGTATDCIAGDAAGAPFSVQLLSISHKESDFSG